MSDSDPDPDPLSAFLVAKPSPPRSVIVHDPSSPQPPDPASPLQGLRIDSPSVQSESQVEEIEVSVCGDGVEPQQHSSTAPSPPNLQESSSTATGPCAASKAPSTQEVGQHQSPPHPASPTLMDPELQAKGWQLLPDLAKDLNRMAEQRSEQQIEDGGAAFNPSDSGRFQCTDQVHEQEKELQGGLAQEATGLQHRTPACLKGKERQDGQSIHGDQDTSKQPRDSSMLEKRSYEPNQGASSSSQVRFIASPGANEEKSAGSSKDRGADCKDRVIQHSHKPNITGFEFFKMKLEGKCFNCFSPKHIARHCNAPHKCWKCFRSGHKAYQCSRKQEVRHYKSSTTKAQANSASSIQHTSHSATRDQRTFAEVVRGEPSMAAARYPGDPRARPARASCAVTATGAIKRRRDELVDKAVVCWLSSDSHETEAHHLSDAFLSKLDLRHGQFQILKHYPEQFLVIFSEPIIKQRVLGMRVLSSRGRHFNFAPWNERLHASNVTWEYRVKVRVEGVPVHCWAPEVVALALGKSCSIHYLEEKTHRRERTRTFDLWAWCSDPCDIPNEVRLTVTEPDKERVPASVPLPMAPTHRDAPIDVKRGQAFLLRNHIEFVEDLTFLQGRPRTGGHINRKPFREFVWSYGTPDSIGERLEERQGRGRERDQPRRPRRDDDDDYDYDRSRQHQGIRRHRSVSSWARNPRCRSGVQDCISSHRWHGGRSRVAAAPDQRMVKVWRLKAAKEDKPRKKVSFADPIATILRPPQSDDSVLLIKDPVAEGVKQTLVTSGTEGAVQQENMEPEAVQQALEETLKQMQKLTEDVAGLHFQRPVEKPKMDAIQVMIEKGNLKAKRGDVSRALVTTVGGVA